MIRHFIPITFLQRDVISNEHPTKDLPLSLSSSLERARQGGNELEGNNFCCFFARPPFSLGESPMVDRTWRWRSSANFVRYTVEIFSLDFGWKARVNEFGKGLVNIRWLLNLCTRVNKYCACGTQEIREPEIIPAIYTYVYISDPIYFSIFLNPFFFFCSCCWYPISERGNGLNCYRFEVGEFAVLWHVYRRCGILFCCNKLGNDFMKYLWRTK